MRIPFGRATTVDTTVGIAAGLAGTTAMTLSLSAEQRLRRRATARFDGPVDYDASPHVVIAASTVLHWEPRTPAQREALFLLVHWGYGSAVGAGYRLLRRSGLSRGTATCAFYAGCQTMAMTLFPTVGGTPPPWRWRPSLLVSSLVQHAIYAVTVAAVDEMMHGDDLDTTRSLVGTVTT